jgi:hypothetical protein
MKQVTKTEMKRELQLMPAGFEDEPTVVDVSDSLDAPLPPPLPFKLMRRKGREDNTWIRTLDPAARAVLERAAMPAPNWPLAGRLQGAIAVPARKIPSL